MLGFQRQPTPLGRLDCSFVIAPSYLQLQSARVAQLLTDNGFAARVRDVWGGGGVDVVTRKRQERMQQLRRATRYAPDADSVLQVYALEYQGKRVHAPSWHTRPHVEAWSLCRPCTVVHVQQHDGCTNMAACTATMHTIPMHTQLLHWPTRVQQAACSCMGACLCMCPGSCRAPVARGPSLDAHAGQHGGARCHVSAGTGGAGAADHRGGLSGPQAQCTR